MANIQVIKFICHSASAQLYIRISLLFQLPTHSVSSNTHYKQEHHSIINTAFADKIRAQNGWKPIFSFIKSITVNTLQIDV